LVPVCSETLQNEGESCVNVDNTMGPHERGRDNSCTQGTKKLLGP
jgi:hypothetical protein